LAAWTHGNPAFLGWATPSPLKKERKILEKAFPSGFFVVF
jgi:hypothetical protein